MMGSRSFFGAISDAIPNELTKTNGFSKYIQYIPYVGQALSAIWKGASAIDNFGETYSNGASLGDSIGHGMKGIQGESVDPNKYSEKNQSFGEADGWLKAGKIGNILPSGKSSNTGGGYSSLFGGGSNLFGGGSGSSGGGNSQIYTQAINSVLNSGNNNGGGNVEYGKEKGGGIAVGSLINGENLGGSSGGGSGFDYSSIIKAVTDLMGSKNGQGTPANAEQQQTGQVELPQDVLRQGMGVPVGGTSLIPSYPNKTVSEAIRQLRGGF